MKTSALLHQIGSLATRLFTRHARQAAPAARYPIYSRVEPLEERFVLAAFTVVNLRDDGPGSLRNALAKANATPAVDTIFFKAGLKGTIALTTGDLNITEPVNIAGPGAGLLKVSGSDSSRIFDISADTTVTISRVTITDGLAPLGEGGGGVLNRGTLTMTRVTLDSNSIAPASFQHGGAIDNLGLGARLTLNMCTVINNSANEGGGIYNESGAIATITKTIVTGNRGGGGGDGAGLRNDGEMTMQFSTVSDNVGLGGAYFGGGIRNDGILTIIASTISGNVAQGRGGGIRNTGTLQITNSTIVNNVSLSSAGGGGIILDGTGVLTLNNSTVTGNIDGSGAATGAGGISINGGSLILNNSVVANNLATGANPPNIRGAVTSGGGNFVGVGDALLTGITNGVNGNKIGTVAAPIDPRLGPLQKNGGLTFTRLPLSDSPLLNAGVNALVPIGILKDQRGIPRIRTLVVDIGAVER